LFFYIWIRGTLPRFRFDPTDEFRLEISFAARAGKRDFYILIVYFLNDDG
jgi:hypothetical protein